MHADQLLIPFSWLFLGILVLLILVPYLRGRSDLVTAWNLFLLGSVDFVAISALDAAYTDRHLRDYSSLVYIKFMLGVAVFYITLVIGYYTLKFPRRAAGRFFRKWPPLSGSVLFFMASCAIALVVLPMLLPQIPFVSQMLFQIGARAIAFAVLLAFVAWYQHKSNPILLTTFLGTLAICLVVSVLFGGGRRTMVSILISFPIVLYWLRWRNRKPLRNLLFVGVLGSVTLICIVGYSAIRWFDLGVSGVERNITNSIKALGELPARIAAIEATDVEQLAGQRSVEFSLFAIHQYAGAASPFSSAVFVLICPIPRTFWQGKPLTLGYTLKRDYFGHDNDVVGNWGPGVIGNGYRDGGLPVLAIYALLCAAGLRFFDELLVRQPGNAYILGILAASSGHIIGWPRGDIANMTLQILASFLAGILIGWIGRLVCGTGLTYPRTDHLRYVAAR